MTSGVVTFDAAPNGEVRILAELAELSPGPHGIHIHEAGDCSAADAASAGAHFSPDGHTHGAPTETIHHAGDLGNIVSDERGIAVSELPGSALTLTGRYGVVGRAVVVHAQVDDSTSQPDGNSGERVACGVVQMIETPETG
jgi:Cu-Zn family superoxide dismutase